MLENKLHIKKEALRTVTIRISFCVILPFIRDFFFLLFSNVSLGRGWLKKYLSRSFIKEPKVLMRRPSPPLSSSLSSKYFSQAPDYILTTFPGLKKPGQVARAKQAVVKSGSDSYTEDCGGDNPKIWKN